MGTPVQQEFLTLNEAAVLFGVCTNTIRRRIAAGDLRAVRLGRATRIPRCEVERLVQATRSSVDGLTELQAEAARTNERSGVIAYLAGVLDRIIGSPPHHAHALALRAERAIAEWNANRWRPGPHDDAADWPAPSGGDVMNATEASARRARGPWGAVACEVQMED
jgi:excisionase family DNA binding protein